MKDFIVSTNARNKLWLTGGLFLDSVETMKRLERPWMCVAEMQAALIETWNSYVRLDDDVFIVGGLYNGEGSDLTLSPLDGLARILELLNGNIHIVPGPTDRIWARDDGVGNVRTKNESPIELLAPLTYLKLIDEGRWALSYYPLRVWEQMETGAYHAYSYQLGGPPVTSSGSVAIDNIKRALGQYRPIRLDEFAFTTGMFHVQVEQVRRMEWWPAKHAPTEYRDLAPDGTWYIRIPLGFVGPRQWPLGLNDKLFSAKNTDHFQTRDGSRLIVLREIVNDGC